MAGRFKIVMTADTVGGVWTYSMTLCRALAPYADIHLVTLGGLMSATQERQVREMRHVTVYETNYKLEWMQDPWEDVARTAAKIDGLYHRLRPDIIHFNNYVQLSSEWNCSIVTVFHSCVQTWFRAVKGHAPGAEWDRYTQTVKRALTASDVVVFPTRSLRHMAEDAYGPLLNGTVIHNGSESRTATVAVKEQFIVTAGRLWDEAKNIGFLGGIAQELPWPVKIAGKAEGPDGSVFNTPNTEMLGLLSQAQMRAVQAKAAIFVSPALYEPFGLAVLEGAAAGCALALADIPTFRELWGDAAVYFNPADRKAAVGAITALAEDAGLRQHLSRIAQQKAKGYSAQQMGENYLSVYKKLSAQKAISIN